MVKKGVAIIGYGSVGRFHHSSHIINSCFMDLIGIYDIDLEKQEKIKSKNIYAYKSIEELLADSKVEIVIVAIPNHLHKSVSIKCMESGKNVICEKPVALNCEELEEMIECSKKNNVLFTVHQNRRFDPDFLAVKKVLDEGIIDSVFDIESRYHGSRGIADDWRSFKCYGGGMLYDWGIHLVDQILQLKKEDIVEINCYMESITGKEVDDGFNLNIIFADNTKAIIEVETSNFIQLPRFYVRGQNGTMVIDDFKSDVKITRCNVWNEVNVTPIKTPTGVTRTMTPRDENTTSSFIMKLPSSNVDEFYINFCNAIDGKEELIVSHGEMKRALKVLQIARQSANKQRIYPEDYYELNEEYNLDKKSYQKLKK
ncbi:MAG: Gfo/Idh/MocA family oxidoreductase [bacterium]|nr:Gfo/Idh/MocA family oxidoreductase [bacterium]